MEPEFRATTGIEGDGVTEPEEGALEPTGKVTEEPKPEVIPEPERTVEDAFDEKRKEAPTEETPKEELPKEPAEKPQEGAPEAPKPADEPTDEEKAITDEIKQLELTEKAAARFTTLMHRLPVEQTQELQQKADLCDQIVDSWKSVNAQAEQVNYAQQVIGMVNSGDPEKLAQVEKWYMAEAAAIREKLGTEVKTGNYDPDLAQRLEDGELDEAGAKELMQARAMEKQRVQYGQQRAQNEQEAQQIESARASALKDVEALRDELAESDPDFERKLPYLQSSFPRIENGLPPDQWVQAIKEDYAALPKISVAVKQTPLKASGPESMQATPKTASEAFDRG